MNEKINGPARVQIQTQSGCNGRCVFCPNGEVMKSHLEQGRMDLSLFRKIIDELVPLQPRRISPYLMNEPLLDARLPEFVQYVSQEIPDASTLVTTNGVSLTPEVTRSLIDAGLKRVKVSLQSLDPETNKRVMGERCDSEKVVRNIIESNGVAKEMARAGSRAAKTFDLRVSMIVTSLNTGEIEQARTFWRKQGVRLVTSALENRGGNIASIGDMDRHGMASFRGKCPRPSREMCVLWNGDVILCCVDWWRTVKLGNVARQTVEEVWNGARAQTIRAKLKEQDDDSLPKICIDCAESVAPVHRLDGMRKAARNLLGIMRALRPVKK